MLFSFLDPSLIILSKKLYFLFLYKKLYKKRVIKDNNNMKKNNINLLITLLIILITIYIIKTLKIFGICCMFLSILSPLFFGYSLSWILRPIINYFKINKIISVTIIYLLFISIIIFSLFKLIPLIIIETKNIIPTLIYYITHNKYLLKLYNTISVKNIFINNIKYMNSCINNIFSIVINIVYTFIFGFYFSIKKDGTNYFKFVPKTLKNNISKYLRLYIKSIIIDTLFVFIILSFLFYLEGLPNSILFALFVAVTNVIPYIGPYIGGIPVILIAFSTSSNLGIIVLITIIVIQLLESNIISPLIISKNVETNPIYILISIIIFNHFFGIIGMVLATPILLVLKCLYFYYKKKKPKWFNLVLEKL